MARLLLILALAAVVFWVFSIVDCAVQPATRHRGVGKGLWMVVTIVLPVIGGLLWFIVGRGADTATVRAPDDDPEFLRGLGGSSANAGSPVDRRARAEQEARIRELERELERLDDDDNGSDRHRGR